MLRTTTRQARYSLIKLRSPSSLGYRRRSESSSTREFRVVLDNETLYIDKSLAEALGWTPNTGHEGVKLSLHGWDPTYFTITPSGSHAGKKKVFTSRLANRSRTCIERLARGTVQSAQNPKVKAVMDHLKEYDAS